MKCCLRNNPPPQPPRGAAVIQHAGWELKSWSDHTQQHPGYNLVELDEYKRGNRKKRLREYQCHQRSNQSTHLKTLIICVCVICILLQGGRTPVMSDYPAETQKMQSSYKLLLSKSWTLTKMLVPLNLSNRSCWNLMDCLFFCLSSPFSIVALTITTIGSNCSLCFHLMYHKNIMVMSRHVGLFHKMLTPGKLENRPNTWRAILTAKCADTLQVYAFCRGNKMLSILFKGKMYSIFFSTAK